MWTDPTKPAIGDGHATTDLGGDDRTPTGRRYRGKRALDLAIAVPALVSTAPLVAAAALAVRITLGSPVLYRQTRLGLHRQPFDIVKLRTMSDERGTDGALLPDAERLGRLGRLLRATSIDELPQLWNVIRGEMSIVGPRPLPAIYLDRYTDHQARRMDVVPGITGLAQTTGRNQTDWDTRLDLDVTYTEQASLGLDLRIIARTLPAVLAARGVAANGYATMPEFTGSRTDEAPGADGPGAGGATGAAQRPD